MIPKPEILNRSLGRRTMAATSNTRSEPDLLRGMGVRGEGYTG